MNSWWDCITACRGCTEFPLGSNHCIFSPETVPSPSCKISSNQCNLHVVERITETSAKEISELTGSPTMTLSTEILVTSSPNSNGTSISKLLTSWFPWAVPKTSASVESVECIKKFHGSMLNLFWRSICTYLCMYHWRRHEQHVPWTALVGSLWCRLSSSRN